DQRSLHSRAWVQHLRRQISESIRRIHERDQCVFGIPAKSNLIAMAANCGDELPDFAIIRAKLVVRRAIMIRIRAYGAVFILACCSLSMLGNANPASGQETFPPAKATLKAYASDIAIPPLPKTIAGKPYSVSPGKEPGTYIVKWGDSSMIWK